MCDCFLVQLQLDYFIKRLIVFFNNYHGNLLHVNTIYFFYRLTKGARTNNKFSYVTSILKKKRQFSLSVSINAILNSVSLKLRHKKIIDVLYIRWIVIYVLLLYVCTIQQYS